MAQIIKQRQIVDDNWQTLTLAEGEEAASVALVAGPAFYPLAVWQARKAEIIAQGQPYGVLLQPAEDPADLADDLAQLGAIAILFPKFADGRGYSIARLLRERYGYTGELRAVGDVLQDQMFYMQRVGFDAFAVRADRSIEKALAALDTFSDAYQTGVDQPQPLFRRRSA